MRNVQKYRVTMIKEEGFRYEYDGTSPYSIAKMLCSLDYDKRAEEIFGVVACDTRGKIIGIFEISSGSLSMAYVTNRSIFQRLLLCNASTFIAWHNHPSGDCTPSIEDLNMTKTIVDASEIMGIKIQDHIILGDDCYYSMREKGDM